LTRSVISSNRGIIKIVLRVGGCKGFGHPAENLGTLCANLCILEHFIAKNFLRLSDLTSVVLLCDT